MMDLERVRATIDAYDSLVERAVEVMDLFNEHMDFESSIRISLDRNEFVVTQIRGWETPWEHNTRFPVDLLAMSTDEFDAFRRKKAEDDARREADRISQRKAISEAEEMAQYARLRAKYGDDPNA